MCKTPTIFSLHSTPFYNSRQIPEPITGDYHQMTTKAAAGKVDVSGTKYSGKNTVIVWYTIAFDFDIKIYINR